MDDLLCEFAGEMREGYAALLPDLPRWRADPHDRPMRDSIFRFLHSAKGGADFVRMARIEHLAIAAETALYDLRHWDLPDGAQQVALILAALARIDAIAEAIEIGIGLPVAGEESLIYELAGERNAATLTDLPYDPQQIGTIRLPLGVIDALTAGVKKLESYLGELGDAPQPSALALLRNDLARHAEAVSALRYVPAGQLFTGLGAYADALVVDREQSVAVHLLGVDVPVDRSALPVLRNALCHLIRNAVAHGIEPHGDRILRNKPAQGLITLAADDYGDAIGLTVTDDGGGIDYAALVANADVAAYAHDDLLELILHPGVTSAKNVSTLAGRGVGLDSVRIAMERLDGRLELFDQARAGFTARLIFPKRKDQANG